MTSAFASTTAPARPRARRGSAMILVLIMTLSLAGLAISAIYLSSSANLLTRYYDKERNYRYGAEMAVALGKSRVNRDTLLAIPDDTAMQLMTAGTLTDAAGTTITNVRANMYVAFTGDTSGRFGKFVTILSQAYDTGGTRMVRRLDLTSESFSRFAMFVDSFPSNLVYGTGEYIRGRSHSNTNWYSQAGAPGPDYYDTVSARGTINGTANYHSLPQLAGAAKIAFPTVAKLAALPTYAASANLSIAPVSGNSAYPHTLGTTSYDLSGQITPAGSANVTRGTRISFKTLDVDNSGSIEEGEGFMKVFDIAAGIDTGSLRVDLPRAGNTGVTNIVMLNQCGLVATINNRKEFFPAARFHEPWVAHRLHLLATAPTFNWTTTAAGDSAIMTGANAAAYNKILGFGVGFSRCFPPGSPYLMLAERNVSPTCVVSTATNTNTLYGWGSVSNLMTTACAAATQYGGQDTTFTATVFRCMYDQTLALAAAGQCYKTGTVAANQVQWALGAWRQFGGTQMTGLPSSGTQLIQAVEAPYLWPIYKPYNLNSKGVIYSSGRLYASDTLRGQVTLYVLGTLVFVDDLVYDIDPTAANALCRNFLGVIARDSVMIADNALNRPRPDAGGTMRFFSYPNATLDMVTMSLTATVGVENYAGTQVTNPALQCSGNPQSGGCINQTGGVIQKYLSATYAGANTGLRENRTVDPCQLTNHKPPFFPQTGRYLDNKYYEIDPTNVSSWTQVKAFYDKLRG